MWWVALTIFLIPLIYLIATNLDDRKERAARLDRIRRRLAEKEEQARGRGKQEGRDEA
jgi:heme exporter protein D